MHRVKRRTNIKKERARPRQDSNLESSDPKSDRYPLGHEAKTFIMEFPLLFDNSEVQIPTVLCFLTCPQFMVCSRSKL